jgi:hypothetical protein
MESPGRRLRGVAYLLSGIASGVLLLYLVFDPAALIDLHPLPLLFLLGVGMVFALWQASVLLR